jgi:hypothetical protein
MNASVLAATNEQLIAINRIVGAKASMLCRFLHGLVVLVQQSLLPLVPPRSAIISDPPLLGGFLKQIWSEKKS